MRRSNNATLVLLALSVCSFACGGGQDGHRVPRNRTLVMDCSDVSNCGGQMKDFDKFNPFIPGAVSKTGWNFLYEPLYFYNAYKATDNLIPWIAERHHFNEDYTEVTVEIRAGVEWSDGMPWTARDLVFTINMLRRNAPDLLFSTDMETWVKDAVAIDDLRAKITLKAPNPRFIFSYFTNNFDNGIPIMPRHIWESEDPSEFANFSVAKGWPVVTGPYRLKHASGQQKIWQLRPDWWAAKIGFQKLPRVEQLTYLTYMEETKRVQNLLANHIDTSLDIRPPNIRTAVEGNPNISTWTGRQPPWGYLDWWPVCLGFNALEAPFDKPQIRWAINHAINREQLVEVGWQNSGSYSLLPFPEFPPVREYTDPLADLLEQYDVGLYDVQKSARIMAAQGWRKDENGFWTKDGKRLKIVIDIFPVFQDLAPVLAAQLQQAGFDALFRNTLDAYTRMAQGRAKAFMMGNGGSVRDPYFTLHFYHSRFVRPTGVHAEQFWRWRNATFDKLVDQMAETAPDDPELHGLVRRAMEIWLAELPSIPLVQWYHRIPHNETYWTNWPSARNPYINSAYWHNTWLLVLLNLEPTQS